VAIKDIVFMNIRTLKTEVFTITFEIPGTYSYICLIHPWMTGQVDVS
jgi:plastocyanin